MIPSTTCKDKLDTEFEGPQSPRPLQEDLALYNEDTLERVRSRFLLPSVQHASRAKPTSALGQDGRHEPRLSQKRGEGRRDTNCSRGSGKGGGGEDRKKMTHPDGIGDGTSMSIMW